MRSVANPKPAIPVADKNTWYYMSHKDEALMFELDYPHFVARAGRLKTGIISDGSHQDMTRISEQFIATSGTVVEMINEYVDGAFIRFVDPKVAHTVYTRILKHMTAHQRAMQADLGYEAPDVEEFRHMADFALAVRPTAIRYDSDLDNSSKNTNFRRGMGAIPRFSDSLKEKVEVEQTERDIPKPIQKLDAIERFLEMINGS